MVVGHNWLIKGVLTMVLFTWIVLFRTWGRDVLIVVYLFIVSIRVAGVQSVVEEFVQRTLGVVGESCCRGSRVKLVLLTVSAFSTRQSRVGNNCMQCLTQIDIVLDFFGTLFDFCHRKRGEFSKDHSELIVEFDRTHSVDTGSGWITLKTTIRTLNLAVNHCSVVILIRFVPFLVAFLVRLD